MTDAELRGLLIDCLRLWEIEGKVTVRDTDTVIATPLGDFTVARADPELRPVRWFYQTPERAAAARPPRAAPSIVALLSALRNVMEGAGGEQLKIGA